MTHQGTRTTERALEILVIEDVPADYMLLERDLRKAGLLARSQRIDTNQALRCALEDNWDIVLSDYNVPGMDLKETLRIIQSGRPELPVILVSGSIGEELAVELLHLGLNDFILKERLARLPNAIRRAIGEADERQARQAAENELRKLALAVAQSPGSIVITDTKGRIEYVNQAFEQITGYAAKEIIGENIRILNRGDTPRETYDLLWQTLTRGDIWKGEFHNTRRDGTRYVEFATIAPMRSPDGTVTHYVAVNQDITEKRQSEALIRRLAYYDTLTELPNRARFNEQLSAALSDSRHRGEYGALMVLDIERFKFINDTLGYEAGDQLLREFAHRLRQSLDGEDVVARIGGDEFAALLRGLGRDADQAQTRAKAAAQRLYVHIDTPYRVGVSGGSDVRRAFRIGLCLFGPEDESADVVLKRAEVAWRTVKAEQQDTIRMFNPEMQAVVDIRAELETGLRAALEHAELALFLQPQFDREGGLIGAEALLRWFRCGTDMVSPADFIPLAEDTGLIVPIGQWVIGEACALLRSWGKQARTRQLRLAINVSARQFHQPDFVSRLAEEIAASAIDPSRLKLELTETVILADLDYTLQRMNEIRSLGVRLALDDFGIGYSSLSYLKHLPFDQLKIDQSFVRDMLGDRRSGGIVSAILALGRALGMEVIAEGVETHEHHAFLQDNDCSFYQGYLFGQPLPIDEWTQRWTDPVTTDDA